MKLATHKHVERPRKARSKSQPQKAPSTPPVTGGSPARRWAIPVLCLLLAAGGTWAAFEFIVLAPLPRDLVGKWVVEGGEQDGATFDFYRNGTMIGRVNLQDREGRIEARVRVEGDLLLSTTRNPNTRRDETRTQKIVRLTRSELVLEDNRGQVLRMTPAD